MAPTPASTASAWATTRKRRRDRCRLAATGKNVALVFANDHGNQGPSSAYGAGIQGLPADNVNLIDQVAAANSNTVVVLNTANPVTAPWAQLPAFNPY